MKTIKKIIIYFLLILPSISMADSKEIPFTMDDRDRLIRMEQKFETINKQFEGVNQRFESVNQRFDQLFNFLWAIVGIFTAMMVSVFGFAFWDRKLSLAPLKREDQRIVAVLVDFAKTQPKLTEILRNAGLL